MRRPVQGSGPWSGGRDGNSDRCKTEKGCRETHVSKLMVITRQSARNGEATGIVQVAAVLFAAVVRETAPGQRHGQEFPPRGRRTDYNNGR